MEPFQHDFYQLKVKRGTLAAEARIIKRLAHARLVESRRVRAKFGDAANTVAHDDYTSMSSHYKDVVRPEGRATHLAAMFLKGRDRQDVEDPLRTRSEPDWTKVERMVSLFGHITEQEAKQKLAQWRDNFTTKEARDNFQRVQAEKRHSHRLAKPARDADRRAHRIVNAS